MSIDLKSELVALFTDKQYNHLSPLEKYKVCVNVMAVQPEERVAPLLQDALHWRYLLSASHGLYLRHSTIAECTLLECQALYKALHQSGHAACAATPEAWLDEFERRELWLKRKNREMLLQQSATHDEAHDEALAARLLEHYRQPISSVVSLCRASMKQHAPDCCDTYLLFNALFTLDYTQSARLTAQDYHEARCSNLCQRQASPLHCFNSVVFFCSSKCREHYVALLDAM